MKNHVVVAALASGLALIPGCHRQPMEPTARPAPAETLPDAYGGHVDPAGGGAVVSLGSEEESGGHFGDMLDMLRGRAAGLRVIELPNGDISLRIRGAVKSLIGNQEPLLVVDGMPVPTYAMSNTLRTMDPSEVRSIQILKDVGSTSSYGMRGANGVILIRLKRS